MDRKTALAAANGYLAGDREAIRRALDGQETPRSMEIGTRLVSLDTDFERFVGLIHEKGLVTLDEAMGFLLAPTGGGQL